MSSIIDYEITNVSHEGCTIVVSVERMGGVDEDTINYTYHPEEGDNVNEPYYSAMVEPDDEPDLPRKELQMLADAALNAINELHKSEYEDYQYSMAEHIKDMQDLEAWYTTPPKNNVWRY